MNEGTKWLKEGRQTIGNAKWTKAKEARKEMEGSEQQEVRKKRNKPMQQAVS